MKTVWERTVYKNKTIHVCTEKTSCIAELVKLKQEFSLPAVLLRITYHANISHDVKNKFTSISAIIINQISYT